MWTLFFKHPYYLIKNVDGEDYKYAQVVIHNNTDTLAECGLLFTDDEIFPKLSKRNVNFWQKREEDEDNIKPERISEEKQKKLDEKVEKERVEREGVLYAEIVEFLNDGAQSLLVQCNNLAENRSGMMIDKMKWIWLTKHEDKIGWIPATGDESKDPAAECAIGLWIHSIAKDITIERDRTNQHKLPQFIMLPNSKAVYLTTIHQGALYTGEEVEYCPYFEKKVAEVI